MSPILIQLDSDLLKNTVQTLREMADTLDAQIPTDLPPKRYALIIFDMNGTLTNTPFIDRQPPAPGSRNQPPQNRTRSCPIFPIFPTMTIRSGRETSP